MTRIVDTKPALINPNIVTSSVAVRSQTWSDAAQVVNAAIGAGSVLISSSYIGDTIPAGATFTYRFRSQPTLPNARLVWQIRCSAPFPSHTFTGTFTAATVVAVPSTRLSSLPVYLFETYTGGSTAERDYTLTVQADSKAAVFVESIALVELPRTSLTSAEGGIPVNTQRVGDVISDVTGEGYSAIARSVANAINSRRRVGIYHYYTRNPIAFTATTFSSFLQTSVPVLLRTTTVNATLSTRIACRVYAQQATGDNGEFRFSSVKNGTSASVINITVAGGLKWWPDVSGAPLSFSVDTEDTSSVNGLRTGSSDSILCEGRVSLAARTLTVHGVSIWEIP